MATAERLAAAGNAGPVLATFVGILPETEYLLASDPAWVRDLIRGYNMAFAIGHQLILALLVVVCLVTAPFIGMFAACYSFAHSLCRTAAVHIGRSISDELGYGNLVRTRATYVAWKRKQLQRSGAALSTLPEGGVRPSSRYPVLNEAELGINGTWSWLQEPVRLFNVAFSWGFMAGVILCAFLTIVFSPFIGMFVSAISFSYSLLRSCNRAEGRLMTDLWGVSDLVDQQTALMQEEMGVTNDHPILGGGFPSPSPYSGGGGGGSPAGGYGTAYGGPNAAPLLPSSHTHGAPALGPAPAMAASQAWNGGGGGGGAVAVAAPQGLYQQPTAYQAVAPGAPAAGMYPQVSRASVRLEADDPESYPAKPTS